VVRAPGVAPALALDGDEQVAEPLLELGERRHAVRPAEQRVGELAVDHALLDEVDERVGLGVDVVLVEQHLGVLQHLA
jgi:hypothetical protein